jgi:hypothetical protein
MKRENINTSLLTIAVVVVIGVQLGVIHPVGSSSNDRAVSVESIDGAKYAKAFRPKLSAAFGKAAYAVSEAITKGERDVEKLQELSRATFATENRKALGEAIGNPVDDGFLPTKVSPESASAAWKKFGDEMMKGR